ARALFHTTHRDDIVLDPFVGSGTTIIAAETMNRQARVAELLPQYADVVIQRYIEFTGGGSEVFLIDGEERIPYETIRRQRKK
ncbi:MAG: hypothetical protein KAG97_11690, partial [Victivallales bacterium]|nr:hypothetical protein [Victivallales bacterium]